MRFSFVPACVCLMGFNRKRWCWNWMQQGSWVDGPGSIQTPTLQLCPVPIPSFSFSLVPITEPLNTHRLTDIQIRTSPHTNTNRNTASKHTYTIHKAAHTPAHMLFGIFAPLQSTWFVQSSSVLNPTCSIIGESTHYCVGCTVSVTTASSLFITMMLKQCIYRLLSLPNNSCFFFTNMCMLNCSLTVMVVGSRQQHFFLQMESDIKIWLDL